MIRRTLRTDDRGVTIVEFAVILPAMLTLIFGGIELGHMMLARIVLEGSVTEAARVATASLETNEEDRDIIMRDSISQAMASFPVADGETISIQTTVYRDFSSAYPENYTDMNDNGRYDFGEPYTDRNKNGQWDPALPITGTLGGPGDVVSYTVVYPKKILFSVLQADWALGPHIRLGATTVVRNESVVRRTS